MEGRENGDSDIFFAELTMETIEFSNIQSWVNLIHLDISEIFKDPQGHETPFKCLYGKLPILFP